METSQLIKLSLKTILTALTIALLLFGISNVCKAQTVKQPKKIVRIYDLNLRGNKLQEKQIKQAEKWPVLSVKIIGKNIIKYTYYTNQY